MTSEKAFQLYFALKLHFNSTYDVFTSGTNFRGKNEVSLRKDFKLIFPITKIVNTERSLIEFCVANYLYDNSNFLYNAEYANENYKHWCKVKESLDYALEKDLGTINLFLLKKNCSLDDYLEKQVISDILSRSIEYESLILLDRRISCLDTIKGFDASKYITRMRKASKFVNKGTLGHRHISHIDSFLSNL
jgi:hypothetical protein